MLTCTVFFGAALLFSVEPLVGRLLTPYFGGAAHVWLICLMFFQAMLFIGYLYAHLCAKRLGVWHLTILALPLLNLPLHMQVQPDAHAPLLRLLYVLVVHVSLPFAVLSTTAVVIQMWLSRSRVGRHREPYPLYAASNAGSLIALLGYSFVVEPLVGVKLQAIAWSVIYVFYVALVVASWHLLRPGLRSAEPDGHEEAVPASITLGAAAYGKWLALSCLPSVYLLTVTNYISLEMGSFPLTWILPLALYLGSFIVTFRARGGVPFFIRNLWPETLLAGMVIFFIGPSHWLAIVGHLTVFFLVCLVSHGLLYELRPPTSRLTNFYLTSAFGGWIGGAIVSLAVPFMFTGLYEYPIILLSLGVIFSICHPGAVKTFLPGTPIPIFLARVTCSVLLLSLTWMAVKSTLGSNIQFRHRNFYGTYRIRDLPSDSGRPGVIRQLVHGSTLHGAQFLQPEWQHIPISYYYPGGAISQVCMVKPSP
jgi:hypothetical protein